MSSISKRPRFVHLGLLAALGLTPSYARAQDSAPAAAPATDAVPAPSPVPAGAAAPSAAPAEPPPPPLAASESAPAEQTRDGKKKKKKKHKSDADAGVDESSGGPAGLVFNTSGGALQLKGRVFALADLTHRTETVVNTSGGLTTRDVDSLDLSLQSARIGAVYHSPLRWLSAELELDLAGKPAVKDAYIQAGKRYYVKVGNFKVPTAALELESPWALPTARRGLLNDLLTDWLDVAGRRPGVVLGYRCKCDLKPRLMLGAFQGTVLEQVAPGDRDVVLIEKASLDAQTLAARAEVRLVGVQVGAWYEHRVGSKAPGAFEHYPTLGLDATYDATFANGGLRFWLDGSGGKSLYVHAEKPNPEKDPLFLVGRALVGYRFGGVALGDPYLEPFGFFGVLDPDTEVVADFATEAALGVNAGYWDRARLTLQAEMTNGQRNFPSGFLDNVDPERLSVLLRAGARF